MIWGGGVWFNLILRAEKFTEEERPMMERTSLHAYRLRLDHPVTEERMEFKAELPKDFQAVMSQLRKNEARSVGAP